MFEDLISFGKILLIYGVIFPAIIALCAFMIGNKLSLLKPTADDELVLGLLLPLLWLLVGGMSFITVLALQDKYSEFVKVETKKIVAMQDSLTYIVSKNNMNTDMTYYFMELDQGAYHSHSVSQRDSVVRYANEDFHVDIFQKLGTNKILNWLATIEPRNETKYEFFIPNESVTQEFSIDLE